MDALKNTEEVYSKVNYNRAICKLILEKLSLRKKAAITTRAILDAGTRDGAFLELLQENTEEKSFNWFGITQNKALINKNTNTKFVRNVQGLPPGIMDCAYSLNVLDKTEKDKETYLHLLEKVKIGGLIFILVPANMEIFNKSDEANQIKRRYSEHSLRLLVRTPNSELIEEGNFDERGYWAQKIINRLETKHSKKLEFSSSSLKLYDYLFTPINILIKSISFIFGIRKAKSRWVLVKKIGG